MSTARVELKRASIALEQAGSGPALLLLHGFPSTRGLWRDLIPLFVASGRRVLAPDLAGYGESTCSAPLEPDMETQAELLSALLDALSINQVDLVAHDIGTAAAQIFVARHGQRVRSLVLIDGVHETEWAMEPLGEICNWDPSKAARLHGLLLRRVRSSGRDARLDEQLVRAMMAAYEGEEGGLKLVRAARALRPEQTALLGPALRASGVPALVVWGDKDTYLPVETVGRPLAAMLAAELVVLQSGHFLPLEKPVELSGVVLKFLERLA